MNRDWRNSMLAKVHMAKKQLGLTEDEYRDMLEGQFGVRSAADLTMRQLDELVRRLSRLGFEERTVRARKGDKSVPTERAMSRKAMLSKIEALLVEIGQREGRHVPWDYAAAILKRMHKVDRLDWAKPEQLRHVIAALHRKAFGARPEEVAAQLVTIRAHNPGDFPMMRTILLAQLGVRARAKVEAILASGHSTSVQSGARC